MEKTILIAEDDKDIRGLIGLYLKGEGFKVMEAENGEVALKLAESCSPDLAILDIMMPKMDGFEVIKNLRSHNREIPIIVLSARAMDTDKITGLTLGADDYITKPFNPLEIIARVKAVLRRSSPKKEEKALITVGDLTLDPESYTLTKAGKQVALTPTEYKIISLLMSNGGKIFTKAQLYEAASGEYFVNDENTMMVHISRLRDKLEEDPKSPRYIKTVRGLGYKFENK